jgi:hypothetical protein
MACAAAGDITHAGLAVGGLQLTDAHSVFLDQVIAQRSLVGETLVVHLNGTDVGGGPVSHIENLVAGPEILSGIAMTIQAPRHLQCRLLIHEWHGVHRAVAHIAADTLGDVNTVIKEYEVRQRVDARPLERFPRAITGAYGLEQGCIGPYLRVTVHAGFGRRNPGETGVLDRGVAIATVNAEPSDVMLMTERNRLRLADAFVGDVGRALYGVSDPDQRGHDENGAENSGAGQRIRAAMKDLRHALMRSG